MLLRVMRRVSEKVEVRLVILGEGPLKEELIRTAANLGVDREVLLPGWRDNPFKYMSKAKVFVLSSDYEGLPNVLIEALACGVPVISTDCPSGPKEILEGGKCGIVVPVGDEEAMAEGIIRLLEDGPLRMELAMRGKERVRDFEIARIAKKYREIFA
jgi:glycosyltransferase involved in cell wall biosynthesis